MDDQSRDPGSEREDKDRGVLTAQAWLFGFGAGIVVLILMFAAYMIGFNRGENEGGGGAEQAVEKPQAEGGTEAPAGGPGQDLFVDNCGSCHVLSAAGTSGTTGPDLDGLAPDEQQVEAAIENGGTGSGAMPAGLLEGADAKAVAEYVSGNAGQ
jgi:mono/diheme cytochrome c family protein